MWHLCEKEIVISWIKNTELNKCIVVDLFALFYIDYKCLQLYFLYM